MRPTIWRAAPDQREAARVCARDIGMNAILAHILLNRDLGPSQFVEFLVPTRASVPPLDLLPDIQPAAARLAQAISEREPVCIYGDYDADGSTAGAVMTRFLRRQGVDVSYYVPQRFEEGYGLNAAAIIQIITQHKPKLIVTVDCGSSAAAEIDTAVALGVDVVVTDHHLPYGRSPNVPVVNPQRSDSQYPLKEICGAAVAYRLCQKVAELRGESPDELEDYLLELVAIGTVADLMPLVHENRYYVSAGLDRLRNTESRGLQALMCTARVGDSKPVTARDVAFGLAPRLNAAGRLGDARTAYELLVTEDNREAWLLADELDRLNLERQEVEGRLREEVDEAVRAISLHEHWGLLLAGPDWHEGVVGLVAGRLAQQHNRPTIVLSIQDDIAKGSGRSNAVVNLNDALADCSDLLESYGGHEKAVGLKVPTARLPELEVRFEAAVRARMTEDDLAPTLQYECPVRASHVTLVLARLLRALEPTGRGNPPPLLKVFELYVAACRQTKDGSHLQLRLRTAEKGDLKAFWPNAGPRVDNFRPGDSVEAVGEVRVDHWMDREEPQLLISDLRHVAT